MTSTSTTARRTGTRAPLDGGGGPTGPSVVFVFVLVDVVKTVLTDVVTPVMKAVWVPTIEVTVLVCT
jgi:hypothetical protein